MLQAIGFGSPTSDLKGTMKVYQNLRNICIGNIILSVAGLIPGYWATFLVIDKWGRKPIQLMGFIMLTILFIIMGTYSSPPHARRAARADCAQASGTTS